MSEATKIRVTQLRGLSHKSEAQRLVLKGLGLRRIGHTVEVRDTPAMRGMVVKVQHLVSVEVLRGEAALFGLRHQNGDGTLKAVPAAAAPKKAAPKKAAAKA